MAFDRRESDKRYRQSGKQRNNHKRWNKTAKGRANRVRHKCKPEVKIQRMVAQWRRTGLPEPTRPRPDDCEICGRQDPRGHNLALDHDHITGEFRGWLCRLCNQAIGGLGDNAAGVRKALAYLEKAEAQSWLSI